MVIAPKWIERKVRLSQLKPYPRNPRILTKDQYEVLKEAIQSLGYRNRINCAPDLTICGGHARLRVLKELGWDEVPVLVSDRTLSDNEFRKIIVQDNLNNGQFDFTMLASDFEIEELIDFGMPESWLTGAEEKEPPADADNKLAFDLTEDQAKIVLRAILLISEKTEMDRNSAITEICKEFLALRKPEK